MRTLHLVESDAEAGRVVLETADGYEKFELPIDDDLRRLLSRKPATAQRPSGEPRITPREVQVRVRSGADPEEIAETCGAPLEWVQRFAGPVLAERARVADEARRAKARRPGTDGQTVIFGEAVDERFAAHGIDPQSVRWDAHRREDGQWVLVAHWIGGQAERQAEWGFALSARTVAPLDETAADLLSDRPIRPIAVPPEPEPAGPALTVAPPLAPGLVAFPAMPDAHTGPLPRAEEVFDQATFDEPPLPMHVPDVPQQAPEQAPEPRSASARSARSARNRRAEEPDDERAARAAIPSWDDILLGVRRKHD